MKDEELGRGQYETRVLRLEVTAEVAWLKGLEYRYGGEFNIYSDTDPGFDEEARRIEKVMTSHYKSDPVKVSVVEWE